MGASTPPIMPSFKHLHFFLLSVSANPIWGHKKNSTSELKIRSLFLEYLFNLYHNLANIKYSFFDENDKTISGKCFQKHLNWMLSPVDYKIVQILFYPNLFHMGNRWHIWMTEQVLKVFGKLDERKYLEYNLGNTWTAKLNTLFGCTCEAS